MRLRQIVTNYIYSKDSSIHDFARIYALAVFGFQTEFALDIRGTIKTVLLSVNPNKTVALPCDYVSYSKIGIINQQGEFVCFKINNQLTAYHQEYFDSNERLSGLPTLPANGWLGNGQLGYGYGSLLYLNYWFNGTSYNLFGLGSGTATVGEYKVDEVNKIILFNPHCFHWDQVLLEYLSTGADDENDDYEVDIRCAAAMKAYIRWADVVDRPKKAGQGTVDKLFANFCNEKRKARMRLNPVILNEMQNAERRSWKLVPKA